MPPMLSRAEEHAGFESWECRVVGVADAVPMLNEVQRDTERHKMNLRISKFKISLRFFAFGPFFGGFLLPKSRCPSLAPLSQEQGLMVGIKSIGQSKIQGFSEWRVWKFGGNT